MKKDLNVKLEEQNVVAIHRLGTYNETWNTASYSKTFQMMWKKRYKAKKNLSDDVKFVDNVTKRNLEFMSNLSNSYNFLVLQMWNLCGGRKMNYNWHLDCMMI